MFIPIAEVPSKFMGSGEERHYFYFHERDPELPVEIVITRLPPLFEADKNWHKHDFVEEFSVPLFGEIVIKEKKDSGIETRRHIAESLLHEGEWIVGIQCESEKEATITIDSPNGIRRQEKITFDPKFTEGKSLHTVENSTSDMVTMLTMKRVPKKILKKDPLVFRIDRTPPLDER